jgi:cell shape-determining protein MreC
VPVQIVRSGQRSVVFGLGNGQLELRYMPANADVQVGDMLVTSGLDGVFYLPGFPVAKVVNIERDSAYSFARISVRRSPVSRISVKSWCSTHASLCHPLRRKPGARHRWR